MNKNLKQKKWKDDFYSKERYKMPAKMTERGGSKCMLP